jgi:SAM-dependent methyltransferase
MSSVGYDPKLHDQDARGSLRSARIFLGFLCQLWKPHSVVDFGCGFGTWLLACKELGVERLLGLDGVWIPPEKILDRAIEFQHQDLTKGVCLSESFDLALSLEVAEHLPPDAAEGFVKSIASSADAVVFSAAFVGQPGAGHVNTRPHSYWAARFLAEGYQLFDILRPEFWSDSRVEPWYRQNTFLYVRANHPLFQALSLAGRRPERDVRFVDCIHPWLYTLVLGELQRRLHRG